MARPLMWSSDDGPATRALRQALTWGVGLLYVACTLLCAWGARAAEGTDRFLYVGACGAAVGVVLRCLGGGLRLPDLALLTVPTLLVNAAPDVLPVSPSLVGGLVFTFMMVGALTVVGRDAGLGLVAVATTLWVLASVTGTSGVSVADALDVAFLNVGTCVAQVVFLRSLAGNVRVQDQLIAEQERLEIETTLRDLEQASTAVVRRVLHDDVLSALRAVADAPPGQAGDVRRACRDAAAAVRERTGSA